MTFPVLAATASSTDDSPADANHTATLPASSAGELLIVFTMAGDITSGTINTPSGWSQTTLGTGQGMLFKTADGSEGTSLDFTSSLSRRVSSIACRITGFQGTPEAASDTGDVNAPSLSPSWGAEDTLWLAVAGARRSDWSFTAAPTNYTGLVSVGNPSDTDPSRCKIGLAQRNLNSASEDPGAFSTTGTLSATIFAAVVAIRSAAAVIGNPTHVMLLLLGSGGKAA